MDVRLECQVRYTYFCLFTVLLGFKVHTRVPVVISNGVRAAAAGRYFALKVLYND